MSEKQDITTDKLDEISENRGPVSEIINDSSRTGVLATPEDFTEPDKIYELLLEKIKQYHPSDDFSMIEKAYHIADEAHQGQKRKSGEPYIIHPLCVAIILAELEMDKETIVAGLLHDVIEDTEYSKEDISREFSPEIALLVDGVTKLTQLNLSQDKIEIQAENLRKMFL
ncbi:MAG: bifunctional (p)ppGpp synthetase/guanosine-3',5'-bis(diphosphate) 3'-pyrophosphohydrolase, partial [Eubacterium sp.]|nr:bifunctional (p)ppGpp synthetase/guanosine-3',5'-bis(diphosphate) 3'-pyrophosphohydrolase [Eubacterium sp.]